jgi:predicted MPP superfamily phosphohydrolase
MHLYVFLKLRTAFEPGVILKWTIVLWMILMTIMPLLVRTAEHYWKEKIALLIAWPSYIWMGFIFIFASTLLFTDLLHICYRIAVRCFPDQLPVLFFSQYSGMIALTLSLSASVYAYVEANRVRIEHVVISTTKLPSTSSKIRIVQITDVHVGLLMREDRLRQVIKKIREAKPDLLISTGDLVDGKLNRDDAISAINPLAEPFASVSAPLGKFAIIGNHEVYAGLSQALAFTKAAGFTSLRNRSVQLVNGLLTITGIDDPAVNRSARVDPHIETALLNAADKGSFHLLLKHRPDIQPESDGNFDLQLSGHVHGGQIFPFNLLVKLKHPIPCGTTITKAGSRIHVSRGTGTWGPPMRLFVPPEITIIDILQATTK